MIILEDVSFIRDNSVILQNIHWHIKKNENWVLFGRNGSGKTTLLQIIMGYLYQTEGIVERFGMKSPGYDMRELRKRIGYVSSPLKKLFYESEKIGDIILSGFYASIGLFDEPSPREREKAVKLLEGIGLHSRAEDRFGILSDGEKQKVLMARAFAANPELLILDEPCVNLDLSSREDLLETVEKLSLTRNTTLIYVTHHIEEITSLFSGIYMLKEGQTFFSGNAGDGVTDEKLTSLFERRVTVQRTGERYNSIIAPDESSFKDLNLIVPENSILESVHKNNK